MLCLLWLLFEPNTTLFVTALTESPAALFTSTKHRLTSVTKTKFESTNNKIPFIIDEIQKEATDGVYVDVSKMCINAFFNDGPPGRTLSPWKSFQVGSLQKMQQGDLKMRRRSHSDSNFMFVARKVVPADSKKVQHTPLLLNLNQVAHAQQLINSGADDFVRGDVVGFVEVTTRPYGLGSEDKDVQRRNNRFHTRRPVLTNLCVSFDARQSGVGSLLLDRCEQEVLRRWKLPEIILEVEDDNTNAISFYERRGYKVMFEDPACRRFDLEGLWLRQVRCKRKIFRKDLQPFALPTESHGIKEAQNFGIRVMQGIRDRVFSTV
jgi:ribosomal protein S18 acetylase RimI-like enzyme